MGRIRDYVSSLALALAVLNCGGSKEGGGAPSPTAPGPPAAPAPAPAPLPTSAHAYFEMLQGRSGVIGAYSLRDQAMLDAYAHGPGSGSGSFTYDYANDPDARRQDAAKVTVPPDRAHVQNQVRFPIPPLGGESLLVTWDAWWGKEFAYSNTSIGNYKAFQFASPETQAWTEVKADFDAASKFAPAIAVVTARSYGQPGTTVGPNITDKNPLSPQKAPFTVSAETWTRYWAYFKPAGDWYEFSLWVADENRDAILVLDRLLLKPATDRWESFWLEYNTSTTRIPATRGPLVAYVRNVVMLRGLPDVAQILQRPVR